jgi:PrtD family type I secretion system ABC transporter
MAASRPAGIIGFIDREVALRLIIGGSLLTLVLNALGLVSPLFFTQVYDRVLTTGSIPTLIALVVAAIIAIGLGAAFEQWRSVAFTRLGAEVYADLERPVFTATHAEAVSAKQGRRSRSLDDLEIVRSTISGPLPASLLDLIFAPLLLATLYLMNVWLGHFALFTLALMGIVTFVTQWTISSSMAKATEATHVASSAAESHLRAAEAARAMGYEANALTRWADRNREAIRAHIRAAAQAGWLTAFGRAVRSSAQIIMIAIAAWLAVTSQLSPGAIIAASIILGRIVQPVDALLGGWRQLSQAKIAADRLNTLVSETSAVAPATIPRPTGRLLVDGLTASSPTGVTILRGLSFTIEPGQSVAVLGPSGSGKSTLLRCLMGVWPAVNGVIRLDALPVAEMDRSAVGKWIGFLPQSSELAPGTIGENIARFGEATRDEIDSAVRLAGATSMIETLPQGIETEVGEGGAHLSAGQRRRIALARALFRAPVFVCLDEPEANLDRDGELALIRALQELKASGSTVLIAAHRPSIVAHADLVMILNDGRIAQFGPAANIMPSLSAASLRKVGP